jgi:hypothetical protein
MMCVLAWALFIVWCAILFAGPIAMMVLPILLEIEPD